jgi:hypothetical protein
MKLNMVAVAADEGAPADLEGLKSGLLDAIEDLGATAN